jgi:predicted SAM-dependent methyltransferase
MKSLRKAIRELLYIPINYFTKIRLRSKIKSSSDKLQIIIGAHNTDYKNWLPTNIDSLNVLQKESFQHLFGEKKVTRFLAEHVFEHISYSDALIALKNCYSYLEKGGAVRIAVPDGFHPNEEYINMVKPGGFGEGAHDHKLLYDYKKLAKVFEEAGFKAQLLEYYDETGTFHYNDWDSKDGHVIRSRRYDKRFNEPLGYSSLIIDGIKE